LQSQGRRKRSPGVDSPRAIVEKTAGSDGVSVCCCCCAVRPVVVTYGLPDSAALHVHDAVEVSRAVRSAPSCRHLLRHAPWAAGPGGPSALSNRLTHPRSLEPCARESLSPIYIDSAARHGDIPAWRTRSAWRAWLPYSNRLLPYDIPHTTSR
jgi:hypothetical protein